MTDKIRAFLTVEVNVKRHELFGMLLLLVCATFVPSGSVRGGLTIVAIFLMFGKIKPPRR